LREAQPKTSEGSDYQQRAEQNTIMHVLVTKPAPPAATGPNTKLVLPGTLLGINESQIYARVNGYVKQWLKDIGETAKKGETLAILDIPEVNKQVEEATANFQLAKTAFERWKRLRAEDAVSQQELDEKTALFKQTEAVLKRLRDLQSFGTVVAPFDGTITRRNVNMGDLVNAGNVGTAQSLFTMANVERLHVYVYLPQDRVSQIKVGDTHSEIVVENLSRTQIVMYAGASGDYNPLHSDEVYTTQAAGYPSVFAHGSFSTMSISPASSLITASPISGRVPHLTVATSESRGASSTR
jgi:multidrug efflux pump subunit AcrA (membrane-fusion protein)